MPCKIEINREHIDIIVERDIVSGNRNKKLINFKFIATNDQDEVTGHFAGDYTNDNNIIILQNGELIFYRQNEASIRLIIEDNKIFEFIFINIVIYYKNYYLFSTVYQLLTT